MTVEPGKTLGVTAEDLARLYPNLYHMAAIDSWQQIQEHGLLSTNALLEKWEKATEEKDIIERKHRPDPVFINHPKHGKAEIRDQKPIHEKKLALSLKDNLTVEDWYVILNSKVFFWLNYDRLQTLLCAKAYSGKKHAVLTLDTLSLVKDHFDRITLSPMNSGNTLPIAHPRGIGTFKAIDQYPFQERLRLGDYYTVVELAVTGGVEDIAKYVTKVEEMQCDRKKRCKDCSKATHHVRSFKTLYQNK